MRSVLKLFSPSTLAMALAAFFMAAASVHAVSLDRPFYLEGHCDLESTYNSTSGRLELHYGFDEDDPGYTETGAEIVGEYDANALYAYVPDKAKTTALGAYYSFLGVDAGSSLWIAPQSQKSGMPYMGFCTKEIDDEAAISLWSSITYSLVSTTGPGDFAMWTDGQIPTVYWSSLDATATVNGNNTIVVTTPSHSHVNFGFTEEGVYDVTMRIAGTRNNVAMQSAPETFTFLVGSSTVPEPGTIAMLISGAAAVLLGLWRQRRNMVKQA